MNNWYVITGGPSSGKTTLFKLLGGKGYRVIHEQARELIDQELYKGKTLGQIRRDEGKFQKKVLEMKITLEKKLSKEELIFFDRGIPDTLAYCWFHKIPVDKLLKKALKKSSYKKVFLLELIKYYEDYARNESAEESREIEKLLEKTYRGLNMSVIKVPEGTIKERVKFILKNIN